MLEREAIDEFHHEHRLVGVFAICLRARDARLGGEAPTEALEVFTLHVEIDFLAHGAIELVDHHIDVNALDHRRPSEVEQVGRAAHESDVAHHVLAHVIATNFDGHGFAASSKRRLIDLRDGSRSKRLGGDVAEHIVPIAVVKVAQPTLHQRKWLRRGGRTQGLQRIAVFLRKHVGPGRKNLAQFDERGAELLEQTYEFFGRNALRDFRVTQRLHDFGKTSRRSFVVYAAAKQLRHVFRASHAHPFPHFRTSVHCSAGRRTARKGAVTLPSRSAKGGWRNSPARTFVKRHASLCRNEK